jgi:hypothetical protein
MYYLAELWLQSVEVSGFYIELFHVIFVRYCQVNFMQYVAAVAIFSLRISKAVLIDNFLIHGRLWLAWIAAITLSWVCSVKDVPHICSVTSSEVENNLKLSTSTQDSVIFG